jgi:hypothetical protein
MWEPQPFATLRASRACTGITLPTWQCCYIKYSQLWARRHTKQVTPQDEPDSVGHNRRYSPKYGISQHWRSTDVSEEHVPTHLHKLAWGTALADGYPFRAGFLLGLLLDPEDGDMLLRNVTWVSGDRALHFHRCEKSTQSKIFYNVACSQTTDTDKARTEVCRLQNVKIKSLTHSSKSQKQNQFVRLQTSNFKPLVRILTEPSTKAQTRWLVN